MNLTRDYKYALPPRLLEWRLQEFEMRTELMRSVGAAVALKWGQGRSLRTKKTKMICVCFSLFCYFSLYNLEKPFQIILNQYAYISTCRYIYKVILN